MPQEHSDTRLYNLTEAAKILGEISVWTLRKHIYRGTIQAVRLGRRVAVSAQEIARIQREGLPSLANQKAA